MSKTRKHRSSRGRRQTRKNRKGKRLTLANKSLAPFAQRYITSVKYSDTFTISLVGGNRFMFNLNNLHDPNRTAGGHQPYGWDQLGTIYNRYRVISASYAVQVYPSDGTAPIRFCCLPANEEVSNANVSDACEDPRAKWAVQVPGGPMVKVKGKVYLPSLLGRTKAEYQATQGPLWAGTPADLAVLNIYAQGLNDVTTNVTGVITMKYIVECFDPFILAQS